MRVEGRFEVILEVCGARRLPGFLVFAVAARHVVVVGPGKEVPPTGQKVPPANAPVAGVAVTRRALGAAPTTGPSHYFRSRQRQVQRRLLFGSQVRGEVRSLWGPAGICRGRGRACDDIT